MAVDKWVEGRAGKGDKRPPLFLREGADPGHPGPAPVFFSLPAMAVVEPAGWHRAGPLPAAPSLGSLRTAERKEVIFSYGHFS